MPNWKPRTDAEIDAQIEAARERGRAIAEDPMRAVEAWYDREGGRVMVELANGCLFGFPAELGQGLRGASPEDLGEVEIELGGEGLHWEKLDADLLVPELLRGAFGSKRWMSEIGRTLGSIRSEAKARAARKNGLKGGRPPGKSGGKGERKAG